jgi:hypothetical protein
MKHKILCRWIVFVALAATIVAGCSTAKSDEIMASTAPTTTSGETNTIPPETIGKPHIELTREVIFQILDEATKLLDENETITLIANKYTKQLVNSTVLKSVDSVLMSDNLIVIQKAKNASTLFELRYLILITRLMEKYPDSYCEDHVYLEGTLRDYRLVFYSEYAEAGYSSIKEFAKVSGSGQLPNTGMFHVSYGDYLTVKERYYFLENDVYGYTGYHIYDNHENGVYNEYYKHLQGKAED